MLLDKKRGIPIVFMFPCQYPEKSSLPSLRNHIKDRIVFKVICFV